MNDELFAMGEWVIIKPVKKEQTSSGLFIPTSAQEEIGHQVISMGKTAEEELGYFPKGTIVFFLKDKAALLDPNSDEKIIHWRHITARKSWSDDE
jgi:co-chaperonin GroES (HSP10)